MSGVIKQECPRCGGDCKLAVDLDTGMTAKLDDRLMALTTMDCVVTCTECGLVRNGQISDMDINLETGRLEFGTINIQ
jgi:uncharacterized Zn finger protein